MMVTNGNPNPINIITILVLMCLYSEKTKVTVILCSLQLRGYWVYEPWNWRCRWQKKYNSFTFSPPRENVSCSSVKPAQNGVI